MRNNIFGYIFILFIMIILGFAVYRVKIQNKEEDTNKSAQNQITQEVQKGTEMTLAISEFDTINPIITRNKKVQDIDKIIFEPLIEITEDFRLQYILANECAKVSGNTYVIKLRQGVKWSNGTKFTSDDVKYTIDRLKENSDSVYSQCVVAIQEVDIIDNYTLRVILSEDVNNFMYYLNFPILSNSYYAGENFWNTSKNAAPPTTGNYKISEVTNNTIVLEKNENWWNKEQKPTINKITINLYSTVAELYNSFKMGSVDFITTQNPSYKNYIGTIGYDLTETEGRNAVFLALNTKSNILSDINIRKAIRAAIDKNQAIEYSYGNMYKEMNFPLDTKSYLLEEKEENFYNLEETSNLLSSSEWYIKNGIWQKNINYKTYKLELNMVVRANDNLRCRLAEKIKEQLESQGILIDIIYANDSSYNSYLNNINYDMMLCSIDQPLAPDLTTYFGDNNLASFYNEEVADIMRYLGNITDENELKTKYQRIYDIYNEEVPYIGIARSKIILAKNTNLVGEVKANWYNYFYNINEWYNTK